MKAQGLQSTEVRIGNLVEFEGRIFEIYSLGPEYPTLNTFEFGIGVVDYNNINPIPITDEWLVKFGFECGSKNYSLNVGIELFNYAVKGKFCIWGGKPGWCIVELPHLGQYYINYVHQLQNLYYALTGEELI